MFAHPHWLASLARLFKWPPPKDLLWPLILPFIAMLALILLGEGTFFERLFEVDDYMFIISLLLFFCVFVLVLTTREPGGALGAYVTVTRWIARLSLPLCVAMTLLALTGKLYIMGDLHQLSHYASINAAMLRSQFFTSAWMIAGCGGMTCLFLYLRALVARIPNSGWSRRARWWAMLWMMIPILTTGRWALAAFPDPLPRETARQNEDAGSLLQNEFFTWFRLGIVDGGGLGATVYHYLATFLIVMPEMLILPLLSVLAVEMILLGLAFRRIAENCISHRVLLDTETRAAVEGEALAQEAFGDPMKKTCIGMAVGPALCLLVFGAMSWAYVAYKTPPHDIPKLIETLGGDDRNLRERAQQELLKHGKGPLLTALKDENKQVRARAAIALGDLADPSTVPNLVAALDDHSYWVRGQAAEALGDIGDRSAIPHLLTRLEDSEGYVRSKVTKALVKLEALESVQTLVAQLERRQPSEVAAAVRALGALGDKTVIPHLLPLLNSQKRFVSDAALLAIARINGQAFHELPRAQRSQAAYEWWEREGRRKYAPEENAANLPSPGQ